MCCKPHVLDNLDSSLCEGTLNGTSIVTNDEKNEKTNEVKLQSSSSEHECISKHVLVTGGAGE